MLDIPHDSAGHHSSSSSSSGNALSRKKGGRQIEDLMNELKNSQDDSFNSSSSGTGPGSGTGSGQGSESFMTPKEEKGGSFDTGDPTTTNLYIGNIAPSVTGKHNNTNNSAWTAMLINHHYSSSSKHVVSLFTYLSLFLSISSFHHRWTYSTPHAMYAPSSIHPSVCVCVCACTYVCKCLSVCVCLFVLSLSVAYCTVLTQRSTCSNSLAGTER